MEQDIFFWCKYWHTITMDNVVIFIGDIFFLYMSFEKFFPIDFFIVCKSLLLPKFWIKEVLI